MLETSEVHVLS